jgi:hypothetical protein
MPRDPNKLSFSIEANVRGLCVIFCVGAKGATEGDHL